MKKSLLIIVFAMLLVGIVLYSQRGVEEIEIVSEQTTSTIPEVVAENLYVPWSISMLPDGRLLVAERNGNIKVIGEDTLELKIDGVFESGEGGLMGIALHPNFSENNFLYVYFTSKEEGETVNKVMRYKFLDDVLSFDLRIIERIPGGVNHNGGRIAFGPDGKLYITTGDAGDSELAQDIKSLAGKILRLEDNGVIPEDNPFDSEVYSYGHRNPQGLAWDAEGRMWSVEHGRSGIQSGFDEINLIEKGKNYGWPEIQGSTVADEMIIPALHSGPTVTWAPADLIYKEGKLYFTGLRGSAIYEVPILPDGTLGLATEHFKNQYGRLRAIFLSQEGEIYFGTSNRDGRGRPKTNDDKLFKFTP